MATTANMEFTPQTMRQFSGLIREMQRFTKAEEPKLVRNMGRDFTRKALSVTRIAPRTKSSKFAWSTKTNRHYKLRRKRRLKITGRGFAQSGWVKALQALGVRIPGRIKIKTGKPGKFGIFVDGRKRLSAYVDVGNAIPYIGKLDNQDRIMQSAEWLTLIQTERTLRRLGDRMQNKWRS